MLVAIRFVVEGKWRSKTFPFITRKQRPFHVNSKNNYLTFFFFFFVKLVRNGSCEVNYSFKDFTTNHFVDKFACVSCGRCGCRSEGTEGATFTDFIDNNTLHLSCKDTSLLGNHSLALRPNNSYYLKETKHQWKEGCKWWETSVLISFKKAVDSSDI